MTDTATTEINFTPATIPDAVRSGGEGREPVKWEELLAPLKPKVGEGFLAYQYTKKTAATSRVANIRKRLFTATPGDNWTIVVRPVPNSDPELFGVYVQFNGTYTEEEQKQRAAQRQERAAKLQAAKAAAEAADGAVGAEASVETPAQRVAAARKAQPTSK